MWSENAKAKKCRSAAFFLTPLRPLPIDPSGAKFLIGVGADSISARWCLRKRKTARAGQLCWMAVLVVRRQALAPKNPKDVVRERKG